MQVERALENLAEVDATFPGGWRAGEVREIVNNLGRAPRLLLQNADLFARRVGSLRILQKLTHAKNAGEGIVEFVRDSADHSAHCGQALALYHLLLQFSLGGDVADGNNHAAQLGIRVEELAGRGAHGAPASVAVPGAVLGGSKG